MASGFPRSARQEKYLESHDSEKPKNAKTEERTQRQVCQYIKLQFPSVIFRSDRDSGRWQYSRQELHDKVAMNSGKSFPDLFIYEPRKVDGRQYAGLAIELKAEGATVYLKNGPRKGKLTADPHIQEQAGMLNALVGKGYYADFAVGFDQAVKLINKYLGVPENGQLF